MFKLNSLKGIENFLIEKVFGKFSQYLQIWLRALFSFGQNGFSVLYLQIWLRVLLSFGQNVIYFFFHINYM